MDNYNSYNEDNNVPGGEEASTTTEATQDTHTESTTRQPAGQDAENVSDGDAADPDSSSKSDSE